MLEALKNEMTLSKKFGEDVPHMIFNIFLENVEADKQSRQSQTQLEGTLARTIARDCLNVKKVVPNIDLSASRYLQPGLLEWN